MSNDVVGVRVEYLRKVFIAIGEARSHHYMSTLNILLAAGMSFLISALCGWTLARSNVMVVVFILLSIMCFVGWVAMSRRFTKKKCVEEALGDMDELLYEAEVKGEIAKLEQEIN